MPPPPPRYITPPRIAIIVLIKVYLDGDKVPAESTVPVLSFIVSQILPKKGRARTTTPPTPLSLQDFETRLSSLRSVLPDRTIWDMFVDKLCALDSDDALRDLMDSLEQYQRTPQRQSDKKQDLDLNWNPMQHRNWSSNDPEWPRGQHRDQHQSRKQHQPDPTYERIVTKLSKSSPIGIFVRRAHLEFTRLPFAATVALWNDFVRYRQPTFDATQAKKESRKAAAKTSVEARRVEVDELWDDIMTSRPTTSNLGVALEDESIQDVLKKARPDDVVAYSAHDIDKLLDFQVAAMTRTGHRLPAEVKAKLEHIATSEAPSELSIPSALYYVKYLDAWKAGDYPAALASLHRYFDYTIQARGESYYQYALLNMALLHAHFGHYPEAISAILETVAMAREHNDSACLNYSLSWLYHFGQAHPEETKDIQKSGLLGTGMEALAFLKTRAKDKDDWALLSSSLVAEARLIMMNGGGLATAVENLVGASHLNLVKRLPGATAGQMAIESALWMRLGVSELSKIKTDLFLECYAAGSTDQDVIAAMCRSASTLAAQGRYSSAMQLMSAAVPPSTAVRNPKTHTAWSMHLGLLKLQHALWRNHLVAADHYLAQLRALCSGSGESPHSDVAAQVSILHIKLLLARRDYRGAMELLDKTWGAPDTAASHGGGFDVQQRLKLMTLKCSIWHAAGNRSRQRRSITTKAFSVALRACSLAHSARLLPPLWEAVTALCRILVSLAEFAPARDLLVSSLPHVLTIADRELSCAAYTVLADAHVGLARRAQGAHRHHHQESSISSSPKRKDEEEQLAEEAKEQLSEEAKEQLAEALECLACAFDEAAAIEDVAAQCEVLAKRAVLVKRLHGDRRLAEECAAKYFELKRQAAQEECRGELA